MQRSYDRKISLALRRAAVSADHQLASVSNFDGIGARVRDAQLRTTMLALHQTLADLFRDVGAITEAGREDARVAALVMSFDWDDVLLRRAFPSKKTREIMKMQLLEVGRYNVEAMIVRVLGPQIPLSQQVYKTQALAADWLRKKVDSAIGRGDSPAKLAREVRDYVDPKTSGGATYAARRLARTEINNAYHAVAVAHNADKPWVVGMRWSLSGSHPYVDQCDNYARRDHSGLGIGIFPPTEVPGKPHPQCLCWVAPETYSPDVFLDMLASGQLDEFMGANYGA